MRSENRTFRERVGDQLARPSAEYWLLALCLGALHLVLVQGPGSPAGRMLMLAHLGLFLLWQPVVRGAYRLGWFNASAMAVVLILATLSLSWGSVAVWVIVLASVVSGAAFSMESGRSRLSYRLALIELIVSLLVLILPRLVPLETGIADVFGWLSAYVLPCLIVGIAFGRTATVPAHARGIDFVSAMLMFLVLTVMVLGALVAMWLMQLPYLVAIIFALFSTAGAVAVMAWAWDPHMGGPQLGGQFMRRLLSAGMSFEEWLHAVAVLSEANDDPLDFLKLACDRLTQLPGVCGGRWRVPEGSGEFGSCAAVEWVKDVEALHLTLMLAHRPTASMDWHLDLTVRLLVQFYLEKRHARELEAVSYVRAVHETGARLTHDVKNLLQSLNTLCFTATQAQTDANTLKALVSRQLPIIVRRLSSTLDKLRAPESAEVSEVSMAVWWALAQERYAGSPITFAGQAPAGSIPVSLFDTALDNFIQNALSKQAMDPSVGINVRVGETEGHPWLEVRDTGAAIADEIQGHLFRQPVPSRDGLGMGLYQLSRLAETMGFRLSLGCNETGCVSFRLLQADSVEA